MIDKPHTLDINSNPTSVDTKGLNYKFSYFSKYILYCNNFNIIIKNVKKIRKPLLPKQTTIC